MNTSELNRIIQTVQKTHGKVPVIIDDDTLDPVVIQGTKLMQTDEGKTALLICLTGKEDTQS